MTGDLEAIKEKLKDERSMRVIFVAHCILNENTIYLGGAFRKGPAAAVVDRLQERGTGVIQMPCPEQKAWGGVLKKALWLELGSAGGLHRFRKLYMPLFLWNTKRIYGGVARDIARQIKDYADSGFEIEGIVGIRGSPSCGVRTTMDLQRSADIMAKTKIGDLDRARFNAQCIRDCQVGGKGLFIKALEDELARQGLTIRFFEHDHFTGANDYDRSGPQATRGTYGFGEGPAQGCQ